MISSNDIIIGVWIMPNNTNIGMLEDFLLHLIPTDNSLFQEATTVIETLETNREHYNNLYKKFTDRKPKFIRSFLGMMNPEHR